MSKLSLGVQKAAIATGPADLRDQKWLDEQVATLGYGIDAAKAIWTNWSDGRNVGRLHPGQSAGAYIASLGLRLTLAEAMAALPDGSNRQVAAVAGVNEITVRRERAATNVAPDAEPPAVRGADGKTYPGRVLRVVEAQVIEPIGPAEVPPNPAATAALLRAIEAVTAAREFAPAVLAEAVAPKDRGRMWRDLRRAGTFLGSVALLLEGERT